MDAHRTQEFFKRFRSIRFSAFLLGAICVAIGFSEPVSAGLIFESVRYDGHVRSGSTTGIEQHFTSDPAGPPTIGHPLPATNAPLAAPLSPSNDLDIDFLSMPNAPFGGGLSDLVTVWISNPTGMHSFANSLDATLGFPPVEFETFVYLEELADGEKLFLNHIGIEGESSAAPYDPPQTSMVSGRGSQNDPLHIVLGLGADQPTLANRRGQVKIQLYYGTMPVPEPATFALTGLGFISMIALARGRRRS